jgi:hypothetical protein
LWDLPAGRKLGSLDVGKSAVVFAQFSSDRKWLLTCYTNVHLPPEGNAGTRRPDDGVALFSIPSKEKYLDIAHVEIDTRPSLSADGRFLAVAYRDGSIQVYSLGAKKELFRWRSPAGQPLTQLLFTPRGDLIVNDGQALRQLDLGSLREQLAEIGLGW